MSLPNVLLHVSKFCGVKITQVTLLHILKKYRVRAIGKITPINRASPMPNSGSNMLSSNLSSVENRHAEGALISNGKRMNQIPDPMFPPAMCKQCPLRREED